MQRRSLDAVYITSCVEISRTSGKHTVVLIAYPRFNRLLLSSPAGNLRVGRCAAVQLNAIWPVGLPLDCELAAEFVGCVTVDST